jgi:hypothetical protein
MCTVFYKLSICEWSLLKKLIHVLVNCNIFKDCADICCWFYENVDSASSEWNSIYLVIPYSCLMNKNIKGCRVKVGKICVLFHLLY